MAEAALAADRAHADPAIWIIRRADEAILADAARAGGRGSARPAALGRAVRRQGQYRRGRDADHRRLSRFRHRPDSDAPAVRRLLDAGAVLIGKTNLDQFATGLVGTRSPYGVPRNVFDAALVPGGSSSGSAVRRRGGDRAVRARHRHCRIGPRAGGVRQYRRAEAHDWQCPGAAAWCRPAARSIRSRCLPARWTRRSPCSASSPGLIATDPYARRAPFPHLRRAALSSGRVAMGDVACLCDPDVATAYRDAGAFLNAEPVDIDAVS